MVGADTQKIREIQPACEWLMIGPGVLYKNSENDSAVYQTHSNELVIVVASVFYPTLQTSPVLFYSTRITTYNYRSRCNVLLAVPNRKITRFQLTYFWVRVVFANCILS